MLLGNGLDWIWSFLEVAGLKVRHACVSLATDLAFKTESQ
jgi:hypothetical protein